MATTDSSQCTSFKALIDRVQEVATIPSATARIIELTQSSDSSVADLEQVIRTDPALSASLLKTANAPCFRLSKPVTDIYKAIVLLGLRTVRELALAVSICPLFSQDVQAIGSYTREGLWKHSAGVAIACRMIARRLDYAGGEALFTTGILHDFGLLLLDQHSHDDFAAILQDSSQYLLETKVRKRLGNHQHELAYQVLKNWGLPASLILPIRSHHCPSQADEEATATAVLYLANVLINSLGFGFVAGTTIVESEFNSMLNKLNLTTRDIQIYLDDLLLETQNSAEFMELATTC